MYKIKTFIQMNIWNYFNFISIVTDNNNIIIYYKRITCTHFFLYFKSKAFFNNKIYRLSLFFLGEETN